MNQHPGQFHLKVRGKMIRQDADGLVSLTDIHSAANFSKNKTPFDFQRLGNTRNLIAALHGRSAGKAAEFRTSLVWKKISTELGGVYAHPVIALAYAEFLNPTLAIEVREVFLRYKSGDATLADSILEKASSEANEWAARRALGRIVRNEYTRELGSRGITGFHFGHCTNATYKGLFDRTAKQLKTERGLADSSNKLRDKMSTKELVFIAASEALSIERMQDEGAAGYEACKLATFKASRAIKSAIDADRLDRQKRMD